MFKYGWFNIALELHIKQRVLWFWTSDIVDKTWAGTHRNLYRLQGCLEHKRLNIKHIKCFSTCRIPFGGSGYLSNQLKTLPEDLTTRLDWLFFIRYMNSGTTITYTTRLRIC